MARPINMRRRVIPGVGDMLNAGVAEVWRLVLPPYLAGSAVMAIAYIFNPRDLGGISLSGAGVSVGLNTGFLFAPAMVARNDQSPPIHTKQMSVCRLWLTLALLLTLAAALAAYLGEVL